MESDWVDAGAKGWGNDAATGTRRHRGAPSRHGPTDSQSARPSSLARATANMHSPPNMDANSPAAQSRANGMSSESAKLHWSGQFKGNSWDIHCADALTALRDIANGSVDCTVTSPPYFWLRDYGVQGQIGLESTVDSYVERLCNVLDEVYRVLHRNGLLFLNIADTYYSGKGMSRGTDQKSSKRRFGLRAVDKSGGLGKGLQRKSLIGIPWRVGLALIERGWALRSTIVWHRENCLREAAKDRPSRSYEYIFMLAKDRRYFFDKQPLIDKEVDQDVWTIAARPKLASKLNTAPFPDDLVYRCLQIGCKKGGTVLDPFAGTGTTIRVALSSGFSAIGIDLNDNFCSYAAEQITALR